MKIKILLAFYTLLTIVNIVLFIDLQKEPPKVENYKIIETNVKKEKEYNNNKKYYTQLKYKEFKELYKDNKTHNIAIIGNKTKAEKKFKEYINLLNYYNDKSVFLIQPNKFNKKNQAKYYNLNKDLIEDNNIIVKIKNKKVIAKAIINDESLLELIEEVKGE